MIWALMRRHRHLVPSQVKVLPLPRRARPVPAAQVQAQAQERVQVRRPVQAMERAEALPQLGMAKAAGAVSQAVARRRCQRWPIAARPDAREGPPAR